MTALAPRRSERVAEIGLAALAVLAAALVLYGTRLGIGLLNDSVNYLRAARGLLDGSGLVVMQAFHYAGPVPMTHWPPLYPVLLAAAGWLGLDMEGFARALHALLLAANVLLVGRFALVHGGGSVGALVAALLFATSRDVLFVHQMVLTEPLYLFTALLALALLARHLESPRPALVWGAGVAAALALMTRYVGVALVGCGCLGVLLLARKPLAARAWDALRFAAPGAACLALWNLRNRWLDAPDSEALNERLPDVARLLPPIGSAFTDWLWPFPAEPGSWGPWSAALAATALAAGATALALAAVGALHGHAVRTPESGAEPVAAPPDLRASALLVLFALAHLAFLYATVLVFFDAWVPVARHLLPASVSLVLAGICVAPRLARVASSPRACALALSLAAAALVAAQCERALRYQVDHARLGFGFREPRYTESGLIALARRLPAGVPIFTNSQAIGGLARMDDMRFLPAKRTPQSSRANPDYPQQLRDMERELRERRGVIIVFAGVGDVFPEADELARELPLRLLYAEPQGRAFALRAPGAPAARSGR